MDSKGVVQNIQLLQHWPLVHTAANVCLEDFQLLRTVRLGGAEQVPLCLMVHAISDVSRASFIAFAILAEAR